MSKARQADEEALDSGAKAREDSLEAWPVASDEGDAGQEPTPGEPPARRPQRGNTRAERTTKGSIDKADGTTAQRY